MWKTEERGRKIKQRGFWEIWSLIQDLPPLRCFVLGNSTAALDCPCGKISFWIHQRLPLISVCSYLKRGAAGWAPVFHTYKKEWRRQCLRRWLLRAVFPKDLLLLSVSLAGYQAGGWGRGTATSPREIANRWIQRADAQQPGVVSTKPVYFLKSPSSTWSFPYFLEVLAGKGSVTGPCARDSRLWPLISVTLLLSAPGRFAASCSLPLEFSPCHFMSLREIFMWQILFCAWKIVTHWRGKKGFVCLR